MRVGSLAGSGSQRMLSRMDMLGDMVGKSTSLNPRNVKSEERDKIEDGGEVWECVGWRTLRLDVTVGM